MSQKLDLLLTEKQQDFFFYDDKRINLLSGSVRSGKTYVSLLKFAVFVAKSKKKDEFLMCGVTLTTLKRNCLDLLTDLVGSNNFKYSLTAKEGRLFGRRIFFEGDSDSSREGNIRGMTLKGAYVDEVTLCNQDFYKMLLSRLSVEGAKLYATCNPDAPSHFIKEDYIDKEDELNLKVWNFYLEDNTFLPKEYIRDLKKEYTDVFYDRYILGEWVLAEGIIYKNYKSAIEEMEINISEVETRDMCVSCDYGTMNPFAMLLWVKHEDVWCAISEYYYSGRSTGRTKTDSQYADDIYDWLTENKVELSQLEKLRFIIDPSATSMIVELKRRGFYKVQRADNSVIEGIQNTATAIQLGLIKFSDKLVNWQDEVQGYAWADDPTQDRPIKENDHLMDAMRYFVQTKKIVKKREKKYQN